MFNFNVLKCILAFVHKLRLKIKANKKESVTDVDAIMPFITWRTMVKADQTENNIKLREGVSDIFGIRCISLRVNNIVKPLLHEDSNLLKQIVNFVHKEETGNTKLPSAHLHLKTCIDKVFSSLFSVYVFLMKKKISSILAECYNCRRSKPKQFENRIGPRYALSSPNVGLFAACSIDPCFSIFVKAFPPSRQTSMLVYILHITCLNSGCSEEVILRGLTHADIALGLRTLEMSHNTKISVLFTDRGSNLKKELLEKCGDWIVCNHPSGSQQRNYSEGKIKLARAIWRNVFRQCRGEQGKHAARLDYTELLFLTRMLTLSINSVPYTVLSEKTQGFSPACVLYGSGLAEAILCETEALNFADRPPLKKYKEYMDKILKCRNEVLLTLSIRGESTDQKYNMRNRVRATVSENDIVLWRHQGDKYTMAKVISLHPPPSNSVEIKFGGGTPKTVAIDNLHVLVPANSEEFKHLRERDPDHMSSEIKRAIENSKARVV